MIRRPRIRSRLSISLLALTLAGTAASQPAPAADEAAALAQARAVVAGFGKASVGTINRPTTAAYTALQRFAPSSGVTPHLDLAYGEHELHKLDLFTPESGVTDAPVVIYLHGGGLTAGDKVSASRDGLIYNNIPLFFARHGMVGINANYRLVPEVSWPAGAEDLRLLLDWVQREVGKYGGDPETVFLMCNSAGCNHVATYLFSAAHHRDGDSGVAGALLGSAAVSPTNDNYYGVDPELRAARSVAGMLEVFDGRVPPMLLWSAEYDDYNIESGVARFYLQLCDKLRDCPEIRQFAGHNHVSHTQSINSADDTVAMALLDFIQRTLAARSNGATHE